MEALLSAVGRTFLRVFGGSLITYAPGLLAAPDLHGAVLVGLSGLGASIAAGIRAIQVYIPQITFSKHIGMPYGSYADAAFQGFVGTLCATLPNAFLAHDISTARSLGTSAIVAAITAGLRGVQGILQKGDNPGAGSGIAEPTAPTSKAAATS